jgi:hypothetical protein
MCKLHRDENKFGYKAEQLISLHLKTKSNWAQSNIVRAQAIIPFRITGTVTYVCNIYRSFNFSFNFNFNF